MTAQRNPVEQAVQRIKTREQASSVNSSTPPIPVYEAPDVGV